MPPEIYTLTFCRTVPAEDVVYNNKYGEWLQHAHQLTWKVIARCKFCPKT